MMAASRRPNDFEAGGRKKRVKLELASSYHIIWLDTHICSKGDYKDLKMDFSMKLLETAAVPPDRDPAVDDVIVHIREHGTPITFVDTADDALEFIKKRSVLSKVIFITSGRLGKDVIPEIHQAGLQVYRYYIFCGTMQKHVDWIMEYAEQGLSMIALDAELDLLLRLVRDMCREFIEEGRRLLNTGYAAMALKYFEYALSLGDKAYDLERSNNPTNTNPPSREYRRTLCGEDGLIAKAKSAGAN